MENQKQLVLTFELSDNDNPITDNNGNIIGSVSDVVDAVDDVSPELADLVNFVLSIQRKEIEELQGLEEDSEAEKERLEDDLNNMLSKATQLAEFDITELQNEIEFQAENEQTITVDMAKMINDKLKDIAYALRNIENY